MQRAATGNAVTRSSCGSLNTARQLLRQQHAPLPRLIPRARALTHALLLLASCGGVHMAILGHASLVDCLGGSVLHNAEELGCNLGSEYSYVPGTMQPKLGLVSEPSAHESINIPRHPAATATHWALDAAERM